MSDLPGETVEMPDILPADSGVTEFAIEWLEACVERDADFILENSLDQPKGVFACIATAGSPFGLHDLVDHLRGLKKAGWASLKPIGLMVSDVAWFTGVSQGLLPSGEPLIIRITLVLVRVGGSWKAVHCYVSEGVERQGIQLSS